MNNYETRMYFDGKVLGGEMVQKKITCLGDLDGVFAEQLSESRVGEIVYEVDIFQPVESGTEGGLFFGISRINPGVVGQEFFMTRGHFHSITNRSEFYWNISGKGVLVLMDEMGKCRIEEVGQYSLHYIPGGVAHRLVNTGKIPLLVGACWPSDAGHDYKSILERKFPYRIMKKSGGWESVPCQDR